MCIQAMRRLLFLVVLVVCVVFVNFAGNVCAVDDGKPLELSGALKQVKLFSGLTNQERNILKSVAVLRHCKEGERIIEQGKTLNNMWIVLEGKAEVRVNGKLVATLPEQSLVGEVEFLGAMPAGADVIVLKESRLIELNNSAFAELMKKKPRMGYVIMSEIARIEAQRLHAMDARER